MKGALLLLAKGKGAPADKAGAPPPSDDAPDSSSSVDGFAREAFGALRDGDEDGFVEAFKGAVRACMADDQSDDAEG